MASSPCPTAAPQDFVAQARNGFFLYPGQIFVSSAGEYVSTILGSCVSVCLWDGRLRVGGINHFLVPHESAGHPGTERAGNVAMEQLFARMSALGCRNGDLTAKVFGGANVLKNGGRAPGHTFHVGTNNVQVAMECLSRARVPVVGQDVLGACGRKVIYNTRDGRVWVKRL